MHKWPCVRYVWFPPFVTFPPCQRLTASSSLSANNLTGTLPESLSVIDTLYLVDFSLNHLEGSLPSSLPQLLDLTYLYLYQNFKLSGNLPEDMGNMTSLLRGEPPCCCSGCISILSRAVWGCYVLAQLQLRCSIGNVVADNCAVDLSYNNFTGPLPASIASCSNLHGLFVPPRHCFSSDTDIAAALHRRIR